MALRGVAVVLFTLAAATSAASPRGVEPPSNAPPLALTRLTGPIRVDGLIDEPAWSAVRPFAFVRLWPDAGTEPSEPTETLVAYDDEALYVAGRLGDREPSKIQANSKQRDSADASSDWFGVVIDSFNDKENGLAFFTTPAGLRWDATVSGDAAVDPFLNERWNAFWDVAVAHDAGGWFVEMRIPFSSLRFQDRAGRVVIGLIVWRQIARKDEVEVFPRIPPDWGSASRFKISRAQECVLDGISVRKPLQVAPYLLGGPQSATGIGGTGMTREAGVDLKYGVSEDLTLDLTANTDFAQVEADDRQINLTRFALAFPEKRPFFLERSGTFDFTFAGSDRVFDSRRIGLVGERPVRLYGGVRLVGRLGTWDIGALDMQSAAAAGHAAENFGVLRLRRQTLNPNSYAGGIVASRLGADGAYNTTYGLDTVTRVAGDDYVSVKWAQSFATGRRNRFFSLEPARLRLAWERRTTRGLGYEWTVGRSGATYDPGMGFQLRPDFTAYSGVVRYGWFPGPQSGLFHHQVSLYTPVITRHSDGRLETAAISPAWEFQTRSRLSGRLNPYVTYDDVPALFTISERVDVPVGRYRYAGLEARLSTPGGRSTSLSVLVNAGGFYDGQVITLDATPTWHPSGDLEVGGGYALTRVVFPARAQRLTAHIGRLRLLYMRDTKFSAAAFIQHSTADHALVANLRLRYNPREGVDLYLVYNDTLTVGHAAESTSRPAPDRRALLVKYVYTFAF